MTDQILPHFDPEIGNSICFPVAVHGGVQEPARIGELIPDHHPGFLQGWDRDARCAIILVVENANLPRSLFIRRGLKSGSEAMKRNQEMGTVRFDQSRNLLMIRPPKAIDPFEPFLM